MTMMMMPMWTDRSFGLTLGGPSRFNRTVQAPLRTTYIASPSSPCLKIMRPEGSVLRTIILTWMVTRNQNTIRTQGSGAWTNRPSVFSLSSSFLIKSIHVLPGAAWDFLSDSWTLPIQKWALPSLSALCENNSSSRVHCHHFYPLHESTRNKTFDW